MPFHTFADLNFVASLLFVFAVSYALLTKAKVIDVKGANIVLAMVIGFFAASYAPLAAFLQAILPIAAVLLVFAFFIVFARNLVGKDAKDALPMATGLIISLMLLAVLWNRIAPQLPAGVDPTQLLWVLGTVIVLLIFYTVYRHSGEIAGFHG